MNIIKDFLCMGLISFSLLSCQTEIPNPTPETPQDLPTATAMVAVKTPTLTNTIHPPTSTSIQTATLSKTPSPSPTSTEILSESPTQEVLHAIAEGTCILEDPLISVNTEIFQDPDFENEITNYLNEGGVPEGLLELLVSGESGKEPNLINVIQPDINQDQIPDVLMTITLHHFDGYGETHVLAFVCRNGQYENMILFRRAGAGSRAEGLYSGGGAKIEIMDDLNQDENIEVLFSVNWPGYAEYYLLSWSEGQFTSLIEQMDILGNTRYSFDVEPGNVSVEDIDGDGIYELIVTAMNYQTMMVETKNWYWNGEKYSLPKE